MADLIQCPKCGLRQTARHAYCARCEYGFTGSPDEYVRDDESSTPSRPTPSSTPSAPTASGFGTPTPSNEISISPPSRSRGRRGPDSALRQDRGSLSQRLSQPRADADTLRTEPDDDELPAAPSWNMPVRQSNSFRVPREELQAEQSSRSRPGSDPGTADFHLRGRPQGELYASERSLPPEDPLLADLVAGRVSKNPKITNEFSLPEEVQEQPVRRGRPRSRPDSLAPPRLSLRTSTGSRLEGRTRSRSGVRNTLSGAGEPSLRPGGTNPGVGRGTNPGLEGSVRNRPRTNPGAYTGTASVPRASVPGAYAPSAPRGTNPGVQAPPVPSEYDFRGIEDIDLEAPMERTGRSTPGRARSTPGTHPGRSTPGAPPPERPTADDPEAPPRRPIKPREILGTLMLVAAALYAALALVNGLGVQRARSAVRAAIDGGIDPSGPTADLPKVLASAIDDLELGEDVQRTWADIEGSTNEFRIGAEFRTPIAGIPLRWRVERDGDFQVEQRIRTLDVFVAAGWMLDPAASQALSAYGSTRRPPTSPGGGSP